MGTGENLMKIRFSQIFLAASIVSLIITVLWLMYPDQTRRYHLVLTGMSRGRIHSFKAKFKPYQGKRMGGAAGTATVIKEAVASFSGEPFNVFSLGSMISGTADSYFTRGSAVVQTMKGIGIEAMLPGNLEFSYGQQRLAELAEEAGFALVSSNISEADTGRSPGYISPEMIFNPGGGLKIGLLGISPPETPNLTARSNIEGLHFAQPDDSLRLRVAALRKAGADIVVLLTMFSRDRLKIEEWQPIASAAPDICVLLDYELEAPPAVRRDGIIIKTVSGYNQSKEVDILDVNFLVDPMRIVGFNGRRIAVNHAEIFPDPMVAAIADKVTMQTRELKDVLIGSFASDHERFYSAECPIGNMIADAMLAEGGCDVALHNSGGIQNNIQAGDFTIGDLFSVMPFDNQLVQMTLTGKEILEALKLSASLQRGLLQISGGSYTFVNRSPTDFELKNVVIGGEPLLPEKDYRVCINNFLAEGGDNFVVFAGGRDMQFGRQQRDVVKDYVQKHGSVQPMELKTEGRITRELPGE